MSASALAVGVYLIARYFMHGVGVEGWTSVIVSLYFIGGLVLANMGVLGLYLGKVYNEVRERPLYVIRDLLNFDDSHCDLLAPSKTISDRSIRPSSSLASHLTSQTFDSEAFKS
jgi:dolichol-phosphate mannosyltransferase